MTITFEKLLAGEYQAVATDHKFMNKVTLFKSGGESSLPRVSFSWEKRYYLSLTEEQAARLDTPHVQTSSGYGDQGKFVWARKVREGKTVVKHLTFLNFRRYGWSWATGFNASHGYAGGLTYANNDDGGVDATSPEQVVRDTMVATIAMLPLCMHAVPPGLVYSAHAREALNFLLADALENISHHATPHQRDAAKDKAWDIKHGITSEIID